jgi:hypothetical protein
LKSFFIARSGQTSNECESKIVSLETLFAVIAIFNGLKRE